MKNITVKELIDKLKEMPQDMEVYVDDDTYGPFSFEEVKQRTINVKNHLCPITQKWIKEDKTVVLLDAMF